MTPIDNVFMLSIDAKLDHETLKQICDTGHSRVPVYEEIEIPIHTETPSDGSDSGIPPLAMLTGAGPVQVRTIRAKKIHGILLVKNCVMLDPKGEPFIPGVPAHLTDAVADATPVRKMHLNKVPFVPNNEPLLGILDKFQEGRSHMAIVSRFSVEKAESVKQAVKRGLTQRLCERVGMGDTDSSDASSSEDEEKRISLSKKTGITKRMQFLRRSTDNRSSRGTDIGQTTILGEEVEMKTKKIFNPLEQSMPADAVLAKEGADEFLRNFDPAVMPLGIITLEDVLEGALSRITNFIVLILRTVQN